LPEESSRTSASDIRAVLEAGEDIAHFPEDKPFPSTLILGFVGNVPVHVLAAVDAATGTCIIIAGYRPDPELWEPDFRKRKQP
jgi:hypothetical protein